MFRPSAAAWVDDATCSSGTVGPPGLGGPSSASECACQQSLLVRPRPGVHPHSRCLSNLSTPIKPLVGPLARPLGCPQVNLRLARYCVPHCRSNYHFTLGRAVVDVLDLFRASHSAVTFLLSTAWLSNRLSWAFLFSPVSPHTHMCKPFFSFHQSKVPCCRLCWSVFSTAPGPPTPAPCACPHHVGPPFCTKK